MVVLFDALLLFKCLILYFCRLSDSKSFSSEDDLVVYSNDGVKVVRCLDCPNDFFTIPIKSPTGYPVYPYPYPPGYIAVMHTWHLYPPHVCFNGSGIVISIPSPHLKGPIGTSEASRVVLKVYNWKFDDIVKGNTEGTFSACLKHVAALTTHFNCDFMVGVNAASSFGQNCKTRSKFAFDNIVSIGGGGAVAAVIVDNNTIAVRNMRK